MILDVVRLSLFPALMAFAAASDLLTMTIPNRVSLVLAVAMKGPMVVLFVLCLAALGGYTALLVQIQRRTAERVQKVRPLRPQTVTPDPAYLLRRSASSG